MTTRNQFDLSKIHVISDGWEYDRHIADQLKRDCRDFNVVGFDCEWVTNCGSGVLNDEPIAMLQLTTGRGLILLFRTCKLKALHIDIYKLLENEQIIKVGVDPWRDVKKLKDKYGIHTKGTLDLRFMAEKCGERPLGLANLAREHLGMELDMHFGNHSEWEDNILRYENKIYAAKDSFAGIELFKHFANRLKPGRLRMPMLPISCRELIGPHCIDNPYIYRSERDTPDRRTATPVRCNRGGGDEAPESRMEKKNEQSEGISGMDIAIATTMAAGLGYCVYQFFKPKK